jgi:hypothetical protein
MSLYIELKRCNVFRVGAAHAVTAWLMVEMISQGDRRKDVDHRVLPP